MLNNVPRIHWYQTRDGQSLALRYWPQEEPLANVVYLHGIVSHSGWYESSCAHLASHGFQVHFLDRRGSGLNSVDRDDNKRGDIDRWVTWLNDVVDYVQTLPNDVPRILLGISWGGILATAIVRNYPGLFQGLGLICPGLFSFKAASKGQQFALRTAVACGLEDRRVAIPLQDPTLFTNSLVHQAYIAHDPLSLRKITIRFAKQNLVLLGAATEEPSAIDLPTLLLLASDDPITDNDSTRRFVTQFSNEDKTVIEYPGASHTLEFEADPTSYFENLAAWCSRVAAEHSGASWPEKK